MTGLYIHIPFCRSRCIYCGFYSTTLNAWHQRYVEALKAEMRLRRHEATTPITTVYFGGGTPSCLSATQLQQLLTTADECFDVLWNEAEVTVECNPDDMTPSFAQSLHDMGVNRVSMGVQTLDDQRLMWLHRRHTAEQARQAVGNLRQAGFDNVSLDLMYGFPAQFLPLTSQLQQWQSDVEGIIALKPEHVSAYALSYEEGTPLAQMKNDGAFSPLDDETERAMYETLIDLLTVAGYEHYEISNFAKPGRRSRHNSGYWTGVPYIGLGAAAHSYDGHCRQWNISDMKRYVEGAEQGHLLTEREVIDPQTCYNEHVMLALRTCEGLDLSTLNTVEHRYCLSHARKHIDSHLLTVSDDCLRLTRQGLFVSDMVISDLFNIEH